MPRVKMTPRYKSDLKLVDWVQALTLSSERNIDGIAELLGSTNFLLTASASDALHHCLRQIAVSGRVILSAYTCFRVVQAIRSAGWEPVYIDIDPGTLRMLRSPVFSELRRCSGIPKVLLVTHLYGIPSFDEELLEAARRSRAKVIEDCAMSLGASVGTVPVGSFGDYAIFSFGLGKLFSLGGGGALLSNNSSVPTISEGRVVAGGFLLQLLSRTGVVGSARFWMQEKVKEMLCHLNKTVAHEHGTYKVSVLDVWATSYFARLLGSPRLSIRLDQQRSKSRYWYDKLDEISLKNISTFRPDKSHQVCYPGLPLLVSEPDRLRSALRREGIDSACYFNYTAARVDGSRKSYKGAEQLAKSIVTVPVYSEVKHIESRILRVLTSH